jgi:2-dehydro-3-deoxyphosphogluconate aldolase/(4S)-4-hydroxy-2-oxoglutarate aldolase
MRFLDQIPVIGIIRGAETAEVEGAVAAALCAGLPTLEITLSRPEACDQIAAMKARYKDGIEIGAGTVLDPFSAARAVQAEAEFIVTPALVPEVIAFCREKSVPVFPGAFTPTEIFTAHQMGAAMVKVFPASAVGPGYIKSLAGPFPQIKLMPTGGVSADLVADYLRAGAAAVGAGSELFKKEWMKARDFSAIEAAVRAYLKAVADAVKK